METILNSGWLTVLDFLLLKRYLGRKACVFFPIDFFADKLSLKYIGMEWKCKDEKDGNVEFVKGPQITAKNLSLCQSTQNTVFPLLINKNRESRLNIVIYVNKSNKFTRVDLEGPTPKKFRPKLLDKNLLKLFKQFFNNKVTKFENVIDCTYKKACQIETFVKVFNWLQRIPLGEDQVFEKCREFIREYLVPLEKLIVSKHTPSKFKKLLLDIADVPDSDFLKLKLPKEIISNVSEYFLSKSDEVKSIRNLTGEDTIPSIKGITTKKGLKHTYGTKSFIEEKSKHIIVSQYKNGLPKKRIVKFPGGGYEEIIYWENGEKKSEKSFNENGQMSRASFYRKNGSIYSSKITKYEDGDGDHEEKMDIITIWFRKDDAILKKELVEFHNGEKMLKFYDNDENIYKILFYNADGSLMKEKYGAEEIDEDDVPENGDITDDEKE